MFKRILVANRGEVAQRIIQAAQKMNIETVAVYSQADENAPYLKMATKSVCIGASPSSQSYLNMEALLQVALQNECKAIHPGYGFLAENAMFATLCEQYKISFIGPSPHSIHVMGDKALARKTMKEAGLDVIPGSDGILSNVDEAISLANEIGFPVLLKATAGGGGKGMRICQNEEQLRSAFVEASIEAEKAFGNAALYMEKYIVNGKHIEFQVLGDDFGKVIHLGERECSIQKKHQKLIEESPSPAISLEMKQAWGKRICEAVSKIGYKNAGTIELFLDGDKLYFMEMNTRLQVEHPVTEMVTGVDIVQQQLLLAAGHALKLNQSEITWNGHAIECRINAEDANDNFKPSPGTLTKFQHPDFTEDADIRLDTYVQEGYKIPPFYDSMIAKLIVRGNTRQEAIAKSIEILRNFNIEGVPTTIPILLEVLQYPQFQDGTYHTGTLNEILSKK
ncbi:MAG TPA: acetyl-CoA carboxylase biotin carboxylase subunit [Planctomycetota bacterium]|nr:acetyl-CoA carboxylase biotin carboxylase subunit [Planctomycetota bacterium]